MITRGVAKVTEISTSLPSTATTLSSTAAALSTTASAGPTSTSDDSPPVLELYDKVVTIKAGPQMKCFEVHRGLICHYSTYFKGCLHGGFEEAFSGVVVLQNDKADVFEVFFSWLYTGRLINDKTTELSRFATMDLFARVWCFGDVRGIPKLQNAAIDGFTSTAISQWVSPSPATTRWIYNNSMRGAPLRKFVVEWYRGTHDANGLSRRVGHEAESQDMPKDFYLELALALSRDNTLRSKASWEAVPGSKDYHVELEKEA